MNLSPGPEPPTPPPPRFPAPPPAPSGPTPPTPPPPPPATRGWFARNWKWFVPLVIVLPVVVCCGGVTALVGGVFGLIKSSEPYQHAVAQAQSDPRVAAALGTPVKPGFFVTGGVHLNNDDGNATLTIPLSGPNGSGTVSVVATKTDGVWSYETLEFQEAGSEQRVDLRDAPRGKSE